MRRLILSVLFILMGSQLALAGGSKMKMIPTSVPTLDGWGLIAMFVILGIVGALVLRKGLASKS